MKSNASAPWCDFSPALTWKTPRIFLGLALTFSFLISLRAQTSSLPTQVFDDWRWTSFTTGTGLPSDTVLDIVETQDGITWAASSAGLAWFDGYRWIGIDTAHDLPAPRYTASLRMYPLSNDLLVTCDEILYRGGRSGFHRFPFRISSAIPFEGKILAQHESDFVIIENDSARIFQRDAGSSNGDFPDLFESKDKAAWWNSSRGLMRWEGGGWHLMIPSQSGRYLGIEAHAEGPGGEGLVSFGLPLEMRGLWTWKAHSPAQHSARDDVNQIRSIDVDANGDALVLNRSGEIRLRQGASWSSLTPLPRELKGASVLRFASNGDLWVGTNHGLFFLDRHTVRWTYRQQPSANSNRIHEILRARDGSIWTASADGVQIYKPDGTSQTVSSLNGIRLYEVTGIEEDSEGNIWISSGAYFDGTFRWDGRQWTYFRVDPNTEWLKFHKIRKDREGRLWFLGLSRGRKDNASRSPGVFLYDNHRFTHWSKMEGLRSGYVYAFAESPDGALWFGTWGGLSRWKNGQWTNFLPGKSGVVQEKIFALAVDKSGNLWFGDYSGGGLGCISPGDSVRYYSTADGLLSQNIWDIRCDERGRLWVTSDAGLNCYENGAWKSYDHSTGLRTSRIWPVLPSGDTLYAGTTGSGLGILNLRECLQPMTRVFTDKPVTENATVLLRWHPFASGGFPASDNVLTRYRINGDPWSAWSFVHSVTLENLSVGSYTYEVEGKNLFGEFDTTGTRGYFSVEPPIYLRKGFLLPTGGLTVIAILLSIAYGIRKRSHSRALRKSEAKFRLLTDSTFEGIAIHDHGIILDANKSLINLFGYEPQEFVGRPALDFFSPESHPVITARMLGDYEKPFEAIGLRKDGRKILLEILGKTIPYDSKTARVAAIRDISERKLAEDKLLAYQGQLRSLASELSSTQERERRRMATVLHDSIGQTLAFCKMKLGTLRGFPGLPAADSTLCEISDLLEEAIRNTRSLTFELSPPVLHELGFKAAVAWLAEQTQQRHSVKVRCVGDQLPPPLSEDLRSLLYNAVREFLTNVAKHAGARTATITYGVTGNEFHVAVLDDGKGFDAARTDLSGTKERGFGLFSIQERIRQFGGRLEIDSHPGKGTIASVAVPVNSPPSPDAP